MKPLSSKYVQLCITLLIGFGFAADGQIFVATSLPDGPGAIGEYNFDGLAVNTAIASGLNGPWSGVSDGNGHIFWAMEGTGNGAVTEYTSAGATVTPSLIPQGGEVMGVTVDGKGHLFVMYGTPYGSAFDSVSEYNLDGTLVNASLITKVSGGGFASIACDGSYLYLADSYNNNISKYTVSGTLVSSTFISLAHNTGPLALACDGNGNLFIASNDNVIREYTTAGAAVNTSLISSGLDQPFGLAVFGNDLFVSSQRSGIVGEYTTAGMPINASLITGLSEPNGLVVIPEPLPNILIIYGLGLIILLKRTRQICKRLGLEK